MGRLRLIVVFGLIISLGGCGTPQRQAQAINIDQEVEALNSSAEQYIACVEGVHALPAYAPLRIHIPLHLNDATSQQLTDTHKATPVEIKVLLAVHPQMLACRAGYLNRMSTIVPTVEPIVAASDVPMNDDFTSLVQMKQSWGEYVTRGKAINLEMQAQFNAAWSRHFDAVNAENARINAENVRNTQAVWQSLGNLGDTMQGIAASEQQNNQQNYENMMLNNAPGRCEDYTYETPGTYANGSFTAGAPRTFNPCN